MQHNRKCSYGNRETAEPSPFGLYKIKTLTRATASFRNIMRKMIEKGYVCLPELTTVKCPNVWEGEDGMMTHVQHVFPMPRRGTLSDPKLVCDPNNPVVSSQVQDKECSEPEAEMESVTIIDNDDSDVEIVSEDELTDTSDSSVVIVEECCTSDFANQYSNNYVISVEEESSDDSVDVITHQPEESNGCDSVNVRTQQPESSNVSDNVNSCIQQLEESNGSDSEDVLTLEFQGGNISESLEVTQQPEECSVSDSVNFNVKTKQLEANSGNDNNEHMMNVAGKAATGALAKMQEVDDIENGNKNTPVDSLPQSNAEKFNSPEYNGSNTRCGDDAENGNTSDS